jgi:23S rRNA (uracil1939-C5)-methyltransferase
MSEPSWYVMPPITTNKAEVPATANVEPATANVEIEKLVYGGEGLARIDGQVVLVPFSLPGEQVTITPKRVKNGLLRAGKPEVVTASPERVTPRCEYFSLCGGCQYQHSSYEFELSQKVSILRETLLRLGGISYKGEITVIQREPWFYRNRIQLHFANGRSGFHKAGSHELCEIDHCYISSPLLVEAIKKINGAVKSPQWPSFLRSLELFTNEEQLQLTILDTTRPVAARFFEWCDTFLPALAPGVIEYKAAGHVFQISRGSFFQVNRFLVDALVKEVVGDSAGKHAVDLYAGVGLFSLVLAKTFERVDAVERGGPACRDLEINADKSGLRVTTSRSSAEDFLRELTQAPDLVVADPPRAGLGRDATTEILRILPVALTLVSCDPSTLSRDLKNLLTAYTIERLTLIDLFPQTYHFETVVHLRRT